LRGNGVATVSTYTSRLLIDGMLWPMWKYILASIFLLIGILEIVLALHVGLRDALMQTSPVRFKQAESRMFLLAGISALVMGLGFLLFELFL
jgi:hypothetical protein